MPALIIRQRLGGFFDQFVGSRDIFFGHCLEFRHAFHPGFVDSQFLLLLDDDVFGNLKHRLGFNRRDRLLHLGHVRVFQRQQRLHAIDLTLQRHDALL